MNLSSLSFLKYSIAGWVASLVSYTPSSLGSHSSEPNWKRNDFRRCEERSMTMAYLAPVASWTRVAAATYSSHVQTSSPEVGHVSPASSHRVLLR